MEIMIAVVIIGLLAAMAVPGLNRVRFRATTSRYLNDVRQIRDGAERYALEKGSFPPNGTASLHEDLRGYVSDQMFTATTPLGGKWDWDYDQDGIKAAVSVYQYTATTAQLRDIDQRSDDGVMTTGQFRVTADKAIHVLQAN